MCADGAWSLEDEQGGLKMAEWIKYTGSDEQIEELTNATHGFIVDSERSIFHKPLPGNYIGLGAEYLRGHFSLYHVTAYLLCQPHPRADMICQWAKTGQPVWIRFVAMDINKMIEYETCTPDWNIPGAQYSFDEFK